MDEHKLRDEYKNITTAGAMIYDPAWGSHYTQEYAEWLEKTCIELHNRIDTCQDIISDKDIMNLS